MSEWTQKPLGTLCSIKTGKKDVNEGSPNGAYPFFTCSRDVHSSDTYSFDTDAILIAGNGAVGNTKLYRGKFEAYQRTYVLVGFEEDLDFIFYVLKGSLSEALSKVVSGSTMPYIRKGDLERFPIPLPPLPEQKKIAHILSTVQRAIEAQERIIQTTTELKKALMHKLFTEGLRGEPQKQTEIGLVPESWDVVRFEDSVSIKNGQVDPRMEPFADMLHVGSENIQSDTGRLINLQTNADLKISSGNYHFTPEDVLYSKIRPYLNKVALPDFEGTCSADMYPLRSNSHFTREFLFYYLLSDGFKNAAISFQDRTGIPKINRMQLGSIQLACPSKEEQSEIAATIAICDEKRDAAQRRRDSLQDLFRTLLHELMTGKMRVHEPEFSA